MASMTGAKRVGRRVDQRGRDAGLGAVELVVDGLERGADGLGVRLVGGVDGGPDAADDGAHQVHDRGEEELAGVLPLGDVLEELVEDPGVQGVLQGARAMTEKGDSWANRSKTSPRIIGAASVENR